MVWGKFRWSVRNKYVKKALMSIPFLPLNAWWGKSKGPYKQLSIHTRKPHKLIKILSYFWVKRRVVPLKKRAQDSSPGIADHLWPAWIPGVLHTEAHTGSHLQHPFLLYLQIPRAALTEISPGRVMIGTCLGLYDVLPWISMWLENDQYASSSVLSRPIPPLPPQQLVAYIKGMRWPLWCPL